MDEQKDLENMQENDQKTEQEEYSFLQETIKDEAGGPARRLKKDLLRISCLGLVFGIIACFGFFASKPLMEEIFGEDPRKVTIPEEEEEETLEEEGEAQQSTTAVLTQPR